MNELNNDQAISTAKHLKNNLGGTIFAFPTEESNPFSAYAIVMYVSGKYFVYPEGTNISEASLGIRTIMEECKKIGMHINYEKDVRLISYQAQMDAPDVTMRRLKKGNVSKPAYEKGKDFIEGDEETGELISARGVIKLSYGAMTDEKNPKATQFMNEYYKLLATRKYGKTAAAIKQEVHRMGKDQAIKWIEQTYKKFVHDDMEIMNMFREVAAQ